jgi:hypothetical protein
MGVLDSGDASSMQSPHRRLPYLRERDPISVDGQIVATMAQDKSPCPI